VIATVVPRPTTIKQQPEILTRILKTLSNALNDPITLIIIGLTFAIAIDLRNNPNDNVFVKIADLIGKDTTVGKFVLANSRKIIGAMMLSVGAASAPKTVRLWAIIVVFFIAVLMHEMSYLGYSGTSIGLTLFFRVPVPELRFILMIILGFVLSAVGDTSAPPGSTSSTSPPTSSTTTTTPSPRSGTIASGGISGSLG
jgi:hypothetical protein